MLSKSCDQPYGILIREGLDQGRIHKGEYGDTGSNAKRDDQDGRGSEAWILAQLAQCKSKILRDGFPPECDETMALLAQMGGVAELACGRDVGLPRGHSGGNEVLLSVLAMKGHLFVELAAESIAAEEKVELFGEESKRVHLTSV